MHRYWSTLDLSSIRDILNLPEEDDILSIQYQPETRSIRVEVIGGPEDVPDGTESHFRRHHQL